jgi:hypothetical protein
MVKQRGVGKVHERPIEEFLKSDSNDSDFDETQYTRSTPKKSKSKKSKSKSLPHVHRSFRRKEHYASDDIVSDSESAESEESFGGAFDEDEELEVNPRTGRPARRSTKAKQTTYVESELEESGAEDSEDQKSEPQDESDDEISPPRRRTGLIVKLHLPSEQLERFEEKPTRTRILRSRTTRSASAPRRASSEMRATRRTRASQEPDEPLLELTNSGHARPLAGKSITKPAGKAPIKTASHPSIIVEESQESNTHEEVHDTMDVDGEQTEKHDVLVESIEGPIIPNTQFTESADEAAQGDEDEDDDDIPVRRTTRSQKAQQVSSTSAE